MFSLPRFFIEPESLRDDAVTITGPEAHHIGRVLRLGPGDIITLLDGCGNFYDSRIEEIRDDRVECRVLWRGRAGGEPPLRVVLVQGIAKGERMDFVIQKGTELGAAAFLPVQCGRSVVRLDAQKRVARRERWQRIAREAAKQCGRALAPEVMEPVHWPAALDLIPPGALVLVPWEEESGRSLKAELQARVKPDEVYIIIGPEGGLEKREVDEARRRGAVPVTLGPRILRTETAGLAAITMVLYQWGDLGGNEHVGKESGPGDPGLQGQPV
jgi:16S rRNA (uracil1498-N3)-methyltransferase